MHKNRKDVEIIGRKLKNFTLLYYNSLLFISVSIWLGSVLIRVSHPFIGYMLIGLSTLKLIGMWWQNVRLKLIGIVGLNAVWAVCTYVFINGGHPPVELTAIFPLYILATGVGISIRGRFHE